MESRLVRILSRVGGNYRRLEKYKGQRWMANWEPPLAQTQGRLQYYKAPNSLILPDELKWGLKFPLQFAQSEATLNYQKETDQKVLGFVNEKFETDLLGEGEDFNLDMTLEECEFLIMASDETKAKAASGELSNLTQWMRDFIDRKEVLLTTSYDSLDRVIQQADAMEMEILEDLAMDFEELDTLRIHGDATTLDGLAGVTSAERSIENYIIVQGYADKNPKADVHSRAESLRQLIAVRGAAMRAKLEVQRRLVEKATENNLSEADFLGTAQITETFENAGGSGEIQGEAKTLMGQVQKTLDGDLAMLHALLDEHTGKAAELNDIYGNFMDFSADNKPSLFDNDNFRVELLRHLAGNIYVKDNRYRYQKEQFDRFVASQHHNYFTKKNITLREFSREYAQLIDTLNEMSHCFRSPKIDANYDDFSERTIMPVNATVFYYFFSSNRSGKTFAQWMLSSVRYPNERMRRAYIRFFA